MPLGQRSDCGDARYAGIEVPFACDISDSLEASITCGFDFIIAPLTRPDHRPPPPSPLPPGQLQPPFARSDVLLTSGQWSSQVVGRVSPWISPDAADAALRQASAAMLLNELNWAAHLSLQACVLPGLSGVASTANYSRLVGQFLEGLSNMALWLPVPLHAGSCQPGSITAAPAAANGTSAASPPVTDGSGQQHDGWAAWNQLQTLCALNSRLGVLLQVSDQLPSQLEIDRWLGEPVKALALSTAAFTMNKKGFPVLPKPHQELISQLLRLGVQLVLVRGAEQQQQEEQQPKEPDPTPAEALKVKASPAPQGSSGQQQAGHPMRYHWEYLSYVFRKLPALSEDEELERGYRDFLQSPLQPLQDNLESTTYETFERDSQKYSQYRLAVEAALRDRVPDAEAATQQVTIMVVGAGRGPLVRASLAAAEATGRQVQVWAVEKNVNAVVHLQQLVESQRWQDKVTVVAADMRAWQAPAQADILVSELLGSFGDNELSPECLDGAQRFLKPDGVSIPTAYTSQLQPITAYRVWQDVKAYDDLEHFETPFVVKLHRHAPLADTQDVFTFQHPNKDAVIDNTRFQSLHFDRTGRPAALCHGFAGYFDAQLYGDVHLSIHPPTHTDNMFSWFPIYFPLKDPVRLEAGQGMDVHMWRCVAPHKVWYEWGISAPSVTHIHNVNGRSYSVGL